MKRQTGPQGVVNLWVGQALDVDPFQRPQSYSLPCKGWTCHHLERRLFKLSDEIIIGSFSIVVRRRIWGRVISQARLKIKDFQGIAIRVSHLSSVTDHSPASISSAGPEEFAISINLHHSEERYCLPLHFAFDLDLSLVRLQTWSRLLRLPIILPTLDGGWREEKPEEKSKGQSYARRARFYLASRKPLLSYFREVGQIDPAQKVTGREMIARD